ncbi:MAG TPA: hypothetical protein VMW20_00300 [Candidatus Nanoarchaeia archaeon]|nr:hypothetical protein [Candidatus Nanoarchaeia archaeon]
MLLKYHSYPTRRAGDCRCDGPSPPPEQPGAGCGVEREARVIGDVLHLTIIVSVYAKCEAQQNIWMNTERTNSIHHDG